jgi:HSP20 family protein
MANITRWGPLEDFDDLFKGFMLRPIRADVGADSQVQLKMDVAEDEKAYTVRAEVPGVTKDEIQVSIDGNQISISAEVKREKEIKEGTKVLRSERYYGRVYRAFALAQDVDQEGAKAKYENGVLELVLPKKAANASKRLAIQ